MKVIVKAKNLRSSPSVPRSNLVKMVQDWSVKRRLLGAFVALLIPYLLLIGLGALAITRLWQIVQTIEQEVVEELREGADLQLALARLVMPANDYLITADLAERAGFERRLGTG